MHPIPRDISVFWLGNMARWQSGYAADCKSVYLGSTPGRASILPLATLAQLVERNLAKVEVIGSNPMCRSKLKNMAK